MVADIVQMRPFTIRCAMRGSGRCFARLLERLDAERDTIPGMLGWLATELELQSMPKYELRPDGAFIFEAYLVEDVSAEQAYEQLVGELRAFGFEPAAL
jgi:hypothetical protein